LTFGVGLAGAVPRCFVDFFTGVGTVAERIGDRLRKTLGEGISISMCPETTCRFVDDEKNAALNHHKSICDRI